MKKIILSICVIVLLFAISILIFNSSGMAKWRISNEYIKDMKNNTRFVAIPAPVLDTGGQVTLSNLESFIDTTITFTINVDTNYKIVIIHWK